MTDDMFQPFPKLSRISQGWTITEKIDGTNAQVLITEDGDVFCGSRKRMITPDNDNMGFARWVYGNKDLLLQLGPGRHFGEWWGAGIQRNYGLREKRFSLFNANRWNMDNIPEGLFVVPVLLLDAYVEDIGASCKACMEELRANGSRAAPGYADPEGIVAYHKGSGVAFKKTYDYDEYGKWMQNQERKIA